MQIAWPTEALLSVVLSQKHQHNTGTCLKCNFLVPTPGLLKQKLWWWSSAISVLTSPPGGSLKNNNNKLQVYSIKIQYLYKLQGDHHHKSSCHPWPYSWLSSSILPIPHSHSPVLTTNFISAFDFYFVHLFLESTYKWNHTVSDKGLTSKICEEFIHINNRKTKNPIKTWAEDLNILLKRTNTEFWTLWERERVGWFGRMALKHV